MEQYWLSNSGYYILKDSGTWPEFLGAFLGALFAFVFGLLTYIISKKNERFVLNQNALVKLERILHKHLNNLGILEAIATGAQDILKAQGIPTSRIFPIETPDQAEMDLIDIEFINKVHLYSMSLRALNFNIMTITHTLTRIEDLYINGRTIEAKNFEVIIRMLQGFLNDLPSINKKTKQLLIITRLHIHHLNKKVNLLERLIKNSWRPLFTEELILNEQKKLDEEIKKIQESGDDNF
ncbi:MAG TPA: hypothetical protein VGE63_01560 [Candidatus Paceibacterota bacterium]